MNSDIEKEIQEKGLIQERITPADIENVIKSEQYYRFPGTTLTICLLTLSNGFYVTGESGCENTEKFCEDLGKKRAKENAKRKIWVLESYLLRQKLHHMEQFESLIHKGDS